MGFSVLKVLGAVAVAAVAAGTAVAAPCTADPRYEKLAAWLGDWQLLDPAGQTLGSSRVDSRLSGCAFEETRQRSDGSQELGLTFLDRATDTWSQRWLSSLGQSGLVTLDFTTDGVDVTGVVHDAGGEEILIRGRIRPAENGGWVQQTEFSIDGGASFDEASTTVFRRPGEPPAAPMTGARPPAPTAPEPGPPAAAPVPTAPEPAAPAPTPAPQPSPEAPAASPPDPGASERVATAAPKPVPAPEPAPAPSSVKVRSERLADAPVAETAMQSPMTLEVELGPLLDLPPGAAWRTTELAPYIAERVSIPSVTVQSRERRGKTEVEVVVNLRTRAGQSRVDLETTLLSGETPVASSRDEAIALGKLVRAHDPKEGLPRTVRLTLEPEAFAALFADGKRPGLRLTLTVR